jgi:F0F1-type ATP synthase membrane subunit b/b'
VLRQRYEATEGARKLAAESLERAAAKTAEYATAMRAARTEIYQAQEQAHKRLQEGEWTELTAARRRAEEAVAKAKAELSSDVEAAKAGLARDSELLANQISESILRGSAA